MNFYVWSVQRQSVTALHVHVNIKTLSHMAIGFFFACFFSASYESLCIGQDNSSRKEDSPWIQHCRELCRNAGRSTPQFVRLYWTEVLVHFHVLWMMIVFIYTVNAEFALSTSWLNILNVTYEYITMNRNGIDVILHVHVVNSYENVHCI